MLLAGNDLSQREHITDIVHRLRDLHWWLKKHFDRVYICQIPPRKDCKPQWISILNSAINGAFQPHVIPVGTAYMIGKHKEVWLTTTDGIHPTPEVGLCCFLY